MGRISLFRRSPVPAPERHEAPVAADSPKLTALPQASDGWVVIDFETASTRGTPCQAGAIRFEGRRETGSFETLIFQPERLFDPFNIALHGITPAAVADGPVHEIRAGDAVVIEPGERHWHGAAPQNFMTHLAMHQAGGDGAGASWGDHVTDTEYLRPTANDIDP
jgi:hypothetical protein